MSVQVENLEHNMAKLTVTVDAAEFGKALEQAYRRDRNRINVQGFRRGKAPRKLIEMEYGKDVFYETAANILIQQEYPKAYDESGLDIVSSPELEIKEIEEGKDFVFTAEVAVKPAVKLGKYEGVTVTKIDTSVSDEEVDKEVENERERNARNVATDGPAKKDDTADINFEGFIDDVPFEGGKGENYKLVLGSHSFIDTFEDQLIGKKAGDDVEVNVTFPEDYQAKNLAGKKALFKVHINGVTEKQLPDLDDEFAKDVSEFETLDEYKADVKKRLEDTKKESARRTQEDEALAKIAEKSEMDIPDAMIRTQVDSMVNDMARNMRSQGLSIDQYLQWSGLTAEQLREQVKPDAEKRIRNSLVLEAIAAEKNFEATDADIDAEIEKIAKQYNLKAEDLKKNISDDDKKNIADDIKVQKAVDFIMENVKERAKPKKKAAEKDEGASDAEEDRKSED